MKRLLLFFLVVMVCVPQLSARRKKPKAGEVDHGTYSDASYGFHFNVSDGWDYKVQDDDKHYRLVLTQVNWQVPPDYLDSPDYTHIPKIVVWVDTTSLGLFPFIDSLLSESFKSDQKSELFKEFEILVDDTERDEMQQRGRRTKEIAGEKGIHWTGYAQYTKDVQLSASSVGGKRVKGAYGGSIIGVKHGNQIILFHMMSEWLYHPQIDAELVGMVNTLQFGGSEESRPEKK
ncbi:MAG: hypothetical protein ABIE70_06635 [bacterium]